MPHFRFALNSKDNVREVGVVQSDSFSNALEAITERLEIDEGDTLEIGVHGFPPARYECAWSLNGVPSLRPSGLLAA